MDSCEAKAEAGPGGDRRRERVVVEKFKRAGEPAPPHFSYGAAAGDGVAPGDDFRSDANLCRRRTRHQRPEPWPIECREI